MLKILFYCHVFYPENSGYSNAFQNLINAILDYRQDVQITVVTPYKIGNNSEIMRERLQVIRLQPITNIRKIRYFINQYFYAKIISKIFKDGKYDLLFIETFDDAIFINFLDNDIFKNVLVRIHSTSETEYTFFDKSLNNKIRKCIIKNFISKKIINIGSTNSYHIYFAKKYYFNNNVIEIGNKYFFIIPNTVNISNKEIDLSIGDKLKMFVLGRMDKLGFNQKGFLDLMFALKLLDDNILKRFIITIVGKGEEKTKILELSKDLNNITFIDELSNFEIIDFLKKSDLVVLPSRYEGLSMFALESLATGNILVFSKTGGLVDLVKENENGFLFEPQNIESLANIIAKIALMEKKDLIEMKKKSLEIFNEKFLPEKVAKKFDKVCKLLVGK